MSIKKVGEEGGDSEEGWNFGEGGDSEEGGN